MRECEVKILEVDTDELIKKIVALGAEKTGEHIIVAEFFGNEGRKKIRVRRIGEHCIVTYKERLSMKGVRESMEYEVKVSDYEAFVHMLQGIGFKKYGQARKQRIVYSLGTITFDFDKYDSIPRFVEVEADNIADVQKGVELLGYTMQDTTTMTRSKVKKYYGFSGKLAKLFSW